jgi:hypothetical protein
MAFARSTPNLVPHHEGVYYHNSLLTLTNDITYYVNDATGDDAHDGLTSGTAFKTINHALGLIPKNLEASATLSIAAGRYAESLVLDFTSRSLTGRLNLVGDTTWTTVKTCEIAQVLLTGYGRHVKLDTALAETDEGLRMLVLTGAHTGQKQWLGVRFPTDATKISISSQLNVGETFAIQKPSVSIVGSDPGGTVPVIELQKGPFGGGGDTIYNITDIQLGEDAGSYADNLSMLDGGISFVDCVFVYGYITASDTFGTLLLNLDWCALRNDAVVQIEPIGSTTIYMDQVAIVSDFMASNCAYVGSTNGFFVSHGFWIDYDTPVQVSGPMTYFCDCEIGWSNSHKDCSITGTYTSVDPTTMSCFIGFGNCSGARIVLALTMDMRDGTIQLAGSNHTGMVFSGTVTSYAGAGVAGINIYTDLICVCNAFSDVGSTYINETNIDIGPTAGIVRIDTMPSGTIVNDTGTLTLYQRQ